MKTQNKLTYGIISTIILFILTAMCGCGNDAPDVDGIITIDSESYVLEYYLPKDTVDFYCDFASKDESITCCIKPRLHSCSSVSMLSLDEHLSKYYTLCKKHNDNNYIRPVRCMMPPNDFLGYNFWDLNPTCIHIVSDKDFDDEHPAGTSLGDLFYFRSVTPYPFIKNEYSGEEFTLINKRLNELTAEDMILSMFKELVDWGNQKDKDRIPQYIKEVMNYNDNQIMKMPPHFALLRSDFPTKEKVHTFTITITDDYGNKFTNTCTVDFNEAG